LEVHQCADAARGHEPGKAGNLENPHHFQRYCLQTLCCECPVQDKGLFEVGLIMTGWMDEEAECSVALLGINYSLEDK